jgi:hypothetical protein
LFALKSQAAYADCSNGAIYARKLLAYRRFINICKMNPCKELSVPIFQRAHAIILFCCIGIFCAAQPANVSNNRPSDATSITDAILQGEKRNLQFGPFESYKWRVLEVQGDRALIITEKVIGFRAYHNTKKDVKWKDCDLREYLNGTFLQKFDSEDQKLIIETKVENPSDSPLIADGSNDTSDKVFLLSVKEARRYFSSDSERSNGSWWWLRSQGGNSHSAANVYHDGPISAFGYWVNYNYCGIRPAMWLNLRP